MTDEDDDAGALVYYAAAPPNTDMHVYPLRDLQPHTLTCECACHPRLDEVDGHQRRIMLVTHNSFDGRELVERYGINERRRIRMGKGQRAPRDASKEIRELQAMFDNPQVHALTDVLFDVLAQQCPPETDERAGQTAFFALCRVLSMFLQKWLQAPPPDGVVDPWGDFEVMVDLLDLLVTGPLEVCAEEMMPRQPTNRTSRAH